MRAKVRLKGRATNESSRSIARGMCRIALPTPRAAAKVSTNWTSERFWGPPRSVTAPCSCSVSAASSTKRATSSTDTKFTGLEAAPKTTVRPFASRGAHRIC